MKPSNPHLRRNRNCRRRSSDSNFGKSLKILFSFEKTGALIDWECGDRDRKTFARLMERLKRWKVEIYCADHWDGYLSEIPPEKLVQGKAHTVSIERNNGRQRHWFARFRKKSIVVSWSLPMVDLMMALFARFHVNGNREDIKTLFA